MPVIPGSRFQRASSRAADRLGERYRHALTSQTSTHSAAVSSAIREGAMRTALWVEPAAGTTSSNALRETSQ